MGRICIVPEFWDSFSRGSSHFYTICTSSVSFVLCPQSRSHFSFSPWSSPILCFCFRLLTSVSLLVIFTHVSGKAICRPCDRAQDEMQLGGVSGLQKRDTPATLLSSPTQLPMPHTHTQVSRSPPGGCNPQFEKRWFNPLQIILCM